VSRGTSLADVPLRDGKIRLGDKRHGYAGVFIGRIRRRGP